MHTMIRTASLAAAGLTLLAAGATTQAQNSNT
jgi:hypothetical protein